MQEASEDLTATTERLKELIIKHLSLVGITPDKIQNDAPLFGEGLGLDSLDAVELVVMLQRHFGISVKTSDEGREIFRSINTLAAYVAQHRTK